MYETVLFPTDGSDESLQALDHAFEVVDPDEGVLHALYVVDTSYPYADYDGGGIEVQTFTAALREEGEQAIDAIEERADRAGVEFAGAIRESSAIHRAILAYADENDADVVVMGTHGRRGLERWLLGSVAERVVRTAEIPVLTVRTAADSGE